MYFHQIGINQQTKLALKGQHLNTKSMICDMTVVTSDGLGLLHRRDILF